MERQVCVSDMQRFCDLFQAQSSNLLYFDAPQVFSGRLKPNLQARKRTAGGRSSPVQISEQNLHLKSSGSSMCQQL